MPDAVPCIAAHKTLRLRPCTQHSSYGDVVVRNQHVVVVHDNCREVTGVVVDISSLEGLEPTLGARSRGVQVADQGGLHRAAPPNTSLLSEVTCDMPSRESWHR